MIPYWQGLHVTAHMSVFADLLRDIGDDEIRLELELDEDRDVTRVHIVMADHPGIFSRLCGRIGAGRAPISSMHAPIRPRTAMRPPIFWVQDGDGRPVMTLRNCHACGR